VTLKSGILEVLSFRTETNYDFLYVNGVGYSGFNGPVGVAVQQGSSISFTSDVSVSYEGFKVCLVASSLETTQPTMMPVAAPNPGGNCFSGDSTMLVFNAESNTHVEMKLADVAVGDRVVTMNRSRQRRLATVGELFHSPSEGHFIEISFNEPAKSPKVVVAPLKASAVEPAERLLRATEHHTFPE
jgi:hypothetical protein